MKLPLALLQKFIDMPGIDATELRHVLDDLIGEVKEVSGEGTQLVYNVETLANRGDHLHVLGIARELSARYLSPLKLPLVASSLSERRVSIALTNHTEKCLRYALAEMTLPERMEQRSEISTYLGDTGGNLPIVDLLNYILLEIGQPMHAFDRDKVEGEITIELSKAAEKITALDGKEYLVPPDSILIKDKKKIIAVAGVIGCANSMVTAETRRVLVESATFDPVTIRKTAKSMGVSTDASYAFERGTDVEAVSYALRRLVYLCGGEQGAVHLLGSTLIEGKLQQRKQINLDLAALRKQLNSPRLDAVEVSARLKNLGFQVQPGENDKLFKIGVPSWRVWDVNNPEDLYEEIARTLGYSRIKLELPALDYEVPALDATENMLQRIESSLVGNGFYEVITKAFYSQNEVNLIAELDPKLAAQHLAIKNAVDGNYSHLKVTNILHYAKLAEQNQRKGVLSVKIYELGRLFQAEARKDSKYEFEGDYLTLAASGRWSDNEWQKPESRESVILSFKGVIESVMRSLGHQLVVSESKEALLHPGFQAAVKLGRLKCGFFGLIHPLLKERLDLKQDLLYCQLDADQLTQAIRTQEYIEASDFPAIRRDITVKVAVQELATKVVSYIHDLKANNLNQVAVVDNFKKADEDFRRVTYRLTFQCIDRTLESSEVDGSMQAILSTLNEKHQIQLV